MFENISPILFVVGFPLVAVLLIGFDIWQIYSQFMPFIEKEEKK